MPKVKGKAAPKAPQRRRRAPPPPPPIEPVRADKSSIVTGLVMVIAVIVAGAALLGGSMSKVGTGVGDALDSAAAGLGFAVQDVRIVGLQQDATRAQFVQRVSEVETGDNMFRANPHEIRRRILSSGQVTSAQVYRLWPNQILIHASPARASAVWHDGEAWRVIDGTGQTMEGLAAQDYTDLVRLSGAEAPAGVPALLRFLARSDDVAERLSYAERVSRRRWDIQLRDGLMIRLPADASVLRAADELEALNSAARLTDRSLARIDLRVPGRTFLEPLEEQGAPGAPAES